MHRYMKSIEAGLTNLLAETRYEDLEGRFSTETKIEVRAACTALAKVLLARGIESAAAAAWIEAGASDTFAEVRREAP